MLSYLEKPSITVTLAYRLGYMRALPSHQVWKQVICLRAFRLWTNSHLRQESDSVTAAILQNVFSIHSSVPTVIHTRIKFACERQHYVATVCIQGSTQF